MKAQRAGILVLVLLTPILLAACGGSQAMQLDEAAVANPAIELGGAGDLPSIPLDHYVSGDNPGDPGDPPGDPVYRQVWGKDYLLEHNGTVVENSLLLNPGDERLAWAIYRFSELSDLRPLVLTVEAFPEEWGDEYYVGVANYTHMAWEFFGPADLVEYEVNLSESNDRYVTHLGNFYFVVILHADNVYEHVQSTLICSGYEEPVPPGPPYHLVASDGTFEDFVALSWQPGAGACGYEIWRTSDDVNHPPGTDGGDPGDPDGGWSLIGTTEQTGYHDFEVIPGDIYWYKVRAFCDGGVSEFSNIDSGYAGGEPPPPPPQLSIHGYARYGEQHGADSVTIYVIGPNGVRTTETNVYGHYYMNELGPGVYIVAAYEPHHTFDPHYRIVELSADHPSGEADFLAFTENLPLHCLWGFTYGSLINHEDGTASSGPLGGVTLTILHDELDMVWTSESNEAGFWAHCELPGGGFTVHPGLEGYEFDPPVHDANINGQGVPAPLIFYGNNFLNPGDPER